MVNLSIIVATDEKYGIGANNNLLWHISEDLQRFKSLTTGHTVIMGRKTFDSLPKKLLPKRRNIVLTRDKTFHYDVPPTSSGTLEIIHDIQEIFEKVTDDEEPFIIGGGEIYRLLMPFVSRIYLTRIHQEYPEADAFFPEINDDFLLIEEVGPFVSSESISYSFLTYERQMVS